MENEKYKGFSLVEGKEFSNPEKAIAIIDHLNLNADEGDTIEERENEYTINPRKVKQGTSPEEYKKCMEEFKRILSDTSIQEINAFFELKHNRTVKGGLLYKSIKSRDLTAKVAPPHIEKSFLYVENVLYHLLNYTDDGTPKETAKSLREAWEGKPVKDRREWTETDDGEYSVLTDEEADDRAEDYVDREYLVQAVQAGNTDSSYDDWKQHVIETDGRGTLLSSYDSVENQKTVNGTTYYIYRTN